MSRRAPRRALVTGASSGIGEAVARLLATEGHRVALLARRAGRLEELRADLAESTLGPHMVLPCDVTDATATTDAIRRVGEVFGGLELLVNNAGMGCVAKLEDTDDELLARVVDTNFQSVARVCRDALPLLRKGDRPVVVNVASVVARRGFPGQAVYGATKAAVACLGEALRLEWASEGVAVCTLSPSITDTELFEVQPNPSALPGPDLEGAASAEDVAREVLRLDRHPVPERSLRLSWRVLGAVNAAFPGLADRLLAKRVRDGWSRPRP